ncbi:MAG TPA: VWA domain-containing protein [Actinomycetes bacterium]|nr:VWA domain-containing protein [Actinomycetes bacterium]
MADATATAGGNDSTTSLLASLHGLFDRLRAAGVPVSMVEVVDAVESLRHIDAANRRQFRSALAATLVKRPEDLAAFDLLFDVQFPLRREPTAGRAGQPAAEAGPGDGQTVPAAPSGDLLEALLDALRADDEGALRALAGLAVDQHGGMETQRHASERYYMYRIMRQLDLYRLLQAVAGTEPGDEALGREELKAGIDDFRRLIAEQVRHRLSAARGAEQAAELYRDRQLEELDILDANASQLRELRQAIRPLARKLAARMAKRRRRRRRGRLDVRRTLRHSLAYGGVPVHPAFRARKASKPDLYVLADVSGSVIEFAKFTLSLLHAMDQEFSKLRSFAFVDGVDEVSRMLDEAGDVLDLQRLFTRANVVWADGHSNYGNVFATFEERYGADLDGRSTLLIMGDARNNYRDPGLEVLRRLAGRVRHVYWLNPEPQDEWDTTDSIMSTYAPHCEQVFEVRNLRQLVTCVDEITAV